MKNKKMNSEVYKLRRRVMNLIYEANTIVKLPRVTVRIIEDEKKALGYGQLGNNIIWITERAVTASEFDLRTIVFHELIHAVYGIGHDDNCPLMKPIHTPLSKSECHKLFRKWAS